MNLHKSIVESLIRSARDVFSTMLGTELTSGEVSVEATTSEPNDGVVSFIGIAGSWAGTGSLTCSPAMACRICEAMLMTEASAVNEDVLDAVAEITNMIIGSVKTDLESELGPLGPEHSHGGIRPQFQDPERRDERVDLRSFPLG